MQAQGWKYSYLVNFLSKPVFLNNETREIRKNKANTKVKIRCFETKDI